MKQLIEMIRYLIWSAHYKVDEIMDVLEPIFKKIPWWTYPIHTSFCVHATGEDGRLYRYHHQGHWRPIQSPIEALLSNDWRHPDHSTANSAVDSFKDRGLPYYDFHVQLVEWGPKCNAYLRKEDITTHIRRRHNKTEGWILQIRYDGSILMSRGRPPSDDFTTSIVHELLSDISQYEYLRQETNGSVTRLEGLEALYEILCKYWKRHKETGQLHIEVVYEPLNLPLFESKAARTKQE